jgi:hypothetical protein
MKKNIQILLKDGKFGQMSPRVHKSYKEWRRKYLFSKEDRDHIQYMASRGLKEQWKLHPEKWGKLFGKNSQSKKNWQNINFRIKTMEAMRKAQILRKTDLSKLKKQCLLCNKTFQCKPDSRGKFRGYPEWNKQKYCSNECRIKVCSLWLKNRFNRGEVITK